jgi:hypothetical protein
VWWDGEYDAAGVRTPDLVGDFAAAGSYAGGTADGIIVSASQFGLTAAPGTVIVTGGGIVFGITTTLAAMTAGSLATDRLYVLERSTSVAGAGGTNDTQIYYDADGNGAGAAVLIGVLVDNGNDQIGGPGNTGITVVA